MSLPIPPTTLILGAAKLAQGVASRVGQAIGFDDVLHGTDSVDDSIITNDALTDQLVDSIRARLVQSGLIDSGGEPNQTLQLSVQQDGALRVEGGHPRAAEIEALLGSSPQIVGAASKLARSGGPTEIAIDLTSPKLQANIPVQANLRDLFGG